MEHLGKPVPVKLQELERIVRETMGTTTADLDFNNTKIAFAGKSDEDLKKAAWLFGLMNKYWLVGIGSKVGLAAIRMHLPFVEAIVKNTIFHQFCGGTTLLETQKTIDHLSKYKTQSILDYGAEGKETERDFNHTMNETIRAIEFAAQNEHVPVVSTKLTGMARFELLEKMQRTDKLTQEEIAEYRIVLKRVDAVCHVASQKKVGLFIDAEETWIQDSIDRIVNMMMKRYNQKRAIVFNTFQMYRTDRLDYLKESLEHARQNDYVFGAKLVRGAYMEKERDRAEEMGYPSPIHVDKEATDRSYNDGIRFCVEHFEEMASCNASHNAESNMLQAKLIEAAGIPRNHPHLNFSQLYGMSDNITFNLAEAGYNVAKYVPYGPVREVVPYLIRRAEENSSVTGDMSREYALVVKELRRRGIN